MNEYTLQDLHAGISESFSVKITTEHEDAFRTLTGDMNPLHYDDDFTQKYGCGGGHVVFGMLTASFLSTLAGMYLPGKYSLIHSIDNISFLKPVRAGDVLDVRGVIDDVYEDLRMIKVRAEMRRLDEVVLKAKMKILVLQ